MISEFHEKVGSCPICSSSQLTPGITVSYWREYPLSFSDCKECGAVFANPMPSLSVISKGNSALVKFYQQVHSEDQEFREARQAYLRGRVLASKLSRWKKTGNFLELGCYHAFLSLGLKDHSDWSAEGLEIAAELAEFANQKLGVQVHCGALEDGVLPAGRYDYVLCHDLIEHIHNPREFLESIYEAMAPGGRLQIKTPNASQDLAYSRRCFKEGLPVGMLLNHIMYFSPVSLKKALENVGFRVRKLYCYDVRYSAHDFGWFGLGKPKKAPDSIASMNEALQLKTQDMRKYWSPDQLSRLKRDPKTSAFYGWIKESLPDFFTLRMPYQWEVGHEIFAIAEKPTKQIKDAAL